MTEHQIIEGCIRGDASARRELYDRYAAVMYGVCRRYVGDGAVAEDLLHDGFVTLYMKIGDFRGEGSFEGWCRRIFVTTALGYLRKRNPLEDARPVEDMHRLGSRDASPDGIISAGEIMECMQLLPEGYRTILNLYAVEGYSHREVGEMLGIGEVTSRSQYSRARVRLADILKKRGLL